MNNYKKDYDKILKTLDILTMNNHMFLDVIEKVVKNLIFL